MEPRILFVETGYVKINVADSRIFEHVLDYHVYDRFPRLLRKLEQLLRLDIFLAWQAKKVAGKYDIIWASSEKVGIPLAFTHQKTPLVVIVHHLASPFKRRLVKMTGLTRHWAGVGYLSQADYDLLVSDLNYPPEQLFFYLRARTRQFTPDYKVVSDGPLISLGVTRRDYQTLVAALRMLPGCQAHLYLSSRYGDLLREDIQSDLPDWVKLQEYAPIDQMPGIYRRSRFVVLPLEDTTHFTAGVSVILEAGASGKAIIATRTAGTSSYIIDGETGILIPPADPEAMRDAILTLWNQPELAYRMGLAARRHIENHYDPQVIETNAAGFLRKIAGLLEDAEPTD